MKKIYIAFLLSVFAVFTYGQTVFWNDVEPIFQNNCAPCHIDNTTSGLMISYENLVEVTSTQLPSMNRIEPESTATSYLYLKVTDQHISAGGSGNSMPPGGSLPQSDLDKIEQWILDGALYVVDIDDIMVEQTNHKLYQNYPNPIMNSTTVKFHLHTETAVNLTVFDMGGRAIKTLADAKLGYGSYQVSWMGNDDGGSQVENGIYLIRLTTDNDIYQTIKAFVMK